MSVHIYTAESQPLTRWHDPYVPVRHVCLTNPRKIERCWRCSRLRWARNLRIQVYYDTVRIFCADGCR